MVSWSDAERRVEFDDETLPPEPEPDDHRGYGRGPSEDDWLREHRPPHWE